jgi:phospholipase C
VVIIYQENHSFDNVLGVVYQQRVSRCDGASVGTVSDGTTIDPMVSTPEPSRSRTWIAPHRAPAQDPT